MPTPVVSLTLVQTRLPHSSPRIPKNVLRACSLRTGAPRGAPQPRRRTRLIHTERSHAISRSAQERSHAISRSAQQVRTTGPKGTVRADLIFGLDTKLFSDVGQVELAMGAHAHVTEHQELEVDLLQVRSERRRKKYPPPCRWRYLRPCCVGKNAGGGGRGFGVGRSSTKWLCVCVYTRRIAHLSRAERRAALRGDGFQT